MIEKLGGRKFVIAVVAFLVIVLDKVLGLGLDDATKTQLIALTVGYGAVNSLSKLGK